MSRFKRTKIKSSKKSSVSINEKIALLNKELEKTGMLSEMGTEDFYQSVSDVPNAMRDAWDDTSHDGLPISASFADFNIGAPPIGNVAYSPPHPVDGTRRRGSIWYGIASGFGPAVIPSGGITGIMWIFRQSLSSGFGRYIQLLLYGPEDNKQWGTYISTAFGTEMLVPWDSVNSPFDQSFKDDLSDMDINRFRNPEEFQNETNVQTRTNPVGDSGFLPIDLFKKFVANTFDSAQEGYEYLSEKAREFFFGTGFDTELDTEKDYEKNRKENRPDVTGGGEAEELLQTAVATMLDFTDNPIKYAVQGILNLGGMIPGFDSTATSYNNLVHHTNNNNPLHPDFRKNDPSSPNYEGPVEVKTSDVNRQNIVNSLDKIISNLNDGKGPTNPNGNLTNKEIKKVSDEMKNNYYSNQTNQAYNTFYNSFHSLPVGGDRGDGKPVTTITVKDGKFVQLDSNYWFTDPRDANPLASDESIPSNNFQLPSTIISNTIHGVTNQAVENGKWTPGSDGNPFYSDENKTEIIGTQYNTQQSFTAKPPKSNNTTKDYQKNKNKNKNKLVESLNEGVKLGHFDPEVLNVDIKDLRKGIMPEYPKKAPPEMIDGYSKESRLAPKVVKGEPTIKITKKDLAKFHKLKKSEIEKFMKEIKQINAYLQKNPGDLIHVQQRYPKSDPRLAQLNWKMDQMSDASSKYLDKNFKVNQTSFKLAQDRVNKNTALTNPDYIQKHYDELRGTIKPEPRINRKSPSRFFKKPKKKSSMEAINDKIKQLDKDLLI